MGFLNGNRYEMTTNDAIGKAATRADLLWDDEARDLCVDPPIAGLSDALLAVDPDLVHAASATGSL